MSNHPPLLALRAAAGLFFLRQLPHSSVAAVPGTKTLHFINDLTNTMTCTSPFHKRSDPSGFTTAVLDASVRESPGDMQALAPGFSWVPWWDSKLVPPTEHVKWYMQTFNISVGGPTDHSFFAYVLRNSTSYRGNDATEQNSGDILGKFSQIARGAGQRAALSFRIQDFQFCNRPASSNTEDLSKFWWDNRHRTKAMISGEPFNDTACKKNLQTGVSVGRCNCNLMASMTWIDSAVRENRQGLLLEAIAKYPELDVEIDFLRSPDLFNQTTTFFLQRRAIMQRFFTTVKSAMINGRRLGIRVPPLMKQLDGLGIDLQQLQQEHLVDYVTAGINFNSFLPAFSDFTTMREILPRPFPLLWEVSGFEGRGVETGNCSAYGHQRMSNEQLSTLAAQAYALGADGISAFNFEYHHLRLRLQQLDC